MTIANKREQILQSLSEPRYRQQFVEEEINVGIAFQIRSLRNRQKLTQVNLAKLLGVRQSLVSTWENPNYGKYTLGTLKDLAKVFDVGLLVRFVPFGKLVDWTVNLTPDDIAPPNFSEEESDRMWKLPVYKTPTANELLIEDIFKAPKTPESKEGELIYA